MKNNIILEKRGSHIGFILSFVIFITFLIFIYTIIEPAINIQEDKQALLKNLKISLLEELSSDLTTYIIRVDEAITSDCVELNSFISDITDSRIIIKNKLNEFPSDTAIYNSNNLQILRSNNNNDFFKIYHSSEFEGLSSGSIPSCQELDFEDDYWIESEVYSNEIFQKRVSDTLTRYEDNYEVLKKDLKIPDGSEFGFSFTDKESVIIETNKVNTPTSVYADEISVLYFDDQANLKSGFIIIKVW